MKAETKLIGRKTMQTGEEKGLSQEEAAKNRGFRKSFFKHRTRKV